ncbi:biogenesis of lysosome-related organelles complex 1 subunit 3-like [Trichosurus vulpecula]|uniref:biogenesis of lysosome-related organelles complex 1 subunit 3 n=1 Tax=Trichosurus vulpecula TaxID=9337 RepID=UPI00186ADB0D|nr:biogenesis of lysosome-related organelles complex 1 subunit 3 [Trichosurus vulpecula]XP_036602723.1 biogenesis of lysosome-related organelles complex 1 subunit 3-like [Trichosurus vulpecula]XP_036602724.1 biogenesis of lysosome-related organelles complex 1 subunit 3-like [Trichosurus vulpecula]
MASRAVGGLRGRRPETVVPGEAIETDSAASSSEEEELYLGSAPLCRGRPTGLRVAGEAPETDSEEEPATLVAHADLPPLVVVREPEWAEEEAPAAPALPASGRASLLQHRLAESQARLGHDVSAAVRGVYRRAGLDVAGLAARLAAAQAVGLAAAHSIRLARSDLCALAERLDIVASCRLLPDIQTPAEAGPSPRA